MLRRNRRGLRGGWGTLCGFDHRSDEAVASLGNSFYIDWLLGVVSESGSNLSDGEVDALLVVDEGVSPPDLLDNLVAAYGFSATVDQKCEKLGGLWLQPD
jgi:hypothetical protein